MTGLSGLVVIDKLGVVVDVVSRGILDIVYKHGWVVVVNLPRQVDVRVSRQQLFVLIDTSTRRDK